jgi:hypothetical protein
VKFRAEARVSVDGAEVGRFELWDLSASGAFLTGPALTVGARIVIEITSSPLTGARLEATVVRVQRLQSCDGIGVQFLPAQTMLATLLQDTIIAELNKVTVAAALA